MMLGDQLINFLDNFLCFGKIPILMYHRVSDEGALAVSLKNFDKQMSILQKRGYRALSLDDLKAYLDGKAIGRDKLFMVTFDDGYEDNFNNAKPILDAYNYRAVIFVATQYIGKVSKFFSSDEDRNHAMLNAEQLQSLEKSGWDIANHFHSHRPLALLAKEEIEEEIKKSQSILDGIIANKNNIHRYSLPRESTSEAVKRVLLENGADMIFSSKGIFRGRTYFSAIPRTEIFNYSDENKFLSRLSPIYFSMLKIKER